MKSIELNATTSLFVGGTPQETFQEHLQVKFLKEIKKILLKKVHIKLS